MLGMSQIVDWLDNATPIINVMQGCHDKEMMYIFRYRGPVAPVEDNVPLRWH